MSESPSPDLQARLRKAAAMMRRGNKQLWSQDIEAMAHRRDCVDPEHYGCNALQAVEAMEDAADLLREAASSRPPSPSPHEAIERELRIEWWQHHGCPFAALYGDDGEMQCSSGRHPSLDFKRMSLDELREHVQAIRMARDNEAWDRAAASAPSPQPSANTLPIMDRGHVGSGASHNAPPSTPDYRALYHELLFQVERKHPGETRHETALRYIRQAEQPQDNTPKQVKR